MVLTSNTCIDGPELGEGVVAQLEGTIYKSGFGVAEELKLFYSGKDKMASTVDSYICLNEGIRNVILFQTKIQVHWVFGPVICRGQFAACANNFSFERLGHGPSSFSRKTYENEEGINFYKLLSNQSHLTHRR